jgi:TolB protein
MNLDGSNLRTVVAHGGGDFAPSLSPDGTKIAFQASRSIATQWDIYVVNVDGSNERALIQTALNEELPTWSPDGTRIAFQAGDSTGTDIYVANADGSNIKRLTDGNRRQHAAPAWSPDGTQIAFESNRHQAVIVGSTPVAEYEIFAIDVDGSNLRRLTFDGGANSLVRKPTWSPDGKQIAFEFVTIIPNTLQALTTIAIMNSDGGNVYVIPDLPNGCIFPRWSPVP